MRPETLITTVVTAATDTTLTDLVTVKDELSITTTGDDTFLTRQIGVASSAIQRYCNRIFAPQTIQDQFWFARDRRPHVLRDDIWRLQLSNWPIIAMTSVVDTINGAATTLTEGTDYLADADKGELTRLNARGEPMHWRSPAVVAIYQAGYAETEPGIEEAAILLVKMRYFGRLRDPLIRSQNAPGVWEATYVMGTGPGGADDMPAEVTALIDRYRVPVIA